MNKATKEIVQKIGEFYLAKHNNDEYKAAEDIEKTKFVRITPIRWLYCEHSHREVIIYVRRPGRFIGRRGENLDLLSKYLGAKIVVIEEDGETIEDAILAAATPINESENFDYAVDEWNFDESDED